MLLRVRKPFDICGRSVSPGEVIDLAGLDLPPGRGQMLVDHRFGEWTTDTVAVDNACDACGKPFASAHALSIHKGRAHRGMTEE